MPLPAPASSLLGSIKSDPTLEQRLQRMPADEMTIDVWSLNPEPTPNPQLNETIDFSVDDSATVTEPTGGYIPKRQIAQLGSRQHTEADYRFVGELGTGGTAIVFQAHQRAVDREVAVKMLRSELACKPLARERFLAEARVIGGLDHPNVMALHEVYSDDEGALFYSMKRIDGTSWEEQIDELSEEQNIEILLRVADAIRYAHSRGLVHRDVKPENVMLGRFGEVLLADWGLAIQTSQSQDTSSTSVGGTPAYMAPELATASAGEINFQTDVYLLGAILYRILAGHPPHHGHTLLQCIQAAANNVIQPAEVNGELIEIALEAMATQPCDRFKDVDAFVAAIKNQRQHQQSDRLIRRAVLQAQNCDQDDDFYQKFGIADALLAEAIEIWPNNDRARDTRKHLQLQFAAIATEHGDYDLAANLYEAAGEADSDEAEMVQFHRLRRDVSQVQVSRYSVLFTHLPDPGLLLRLQSGEIVEANLAFANTFGHGCDQLVEHQIEVHKIWDVLDDRERLLQRAIQEGTLHDFSTKLLHQDGEAIDVCINAQIVEIQSEQMLLLTMRTTAS